MTTVRRGIPALFLGALLCLLLLLCLTPSAWADGSTVADLQTAINSGDAIFTLTDDMTISDGFFDGRYGLTLIVPPNKTLTVTGGTAELYGLTLNGGTVKISGGTFRVNEKFTYNSGTVEVLGECFNLFPAADVLALTDFSQVFSYDSDDFVTSLLYAPTTDAEASAAINSINDLDERFFADLVIKFPWTVTGNQAITHKTQLRINCGAGGSLTVAKDASFSHMSRGNVFINNGGAAGSLPACKNLGFMNIGSFHIEPDCTFSSSGIAEIQSLDLGGSVALDGGTFRVNNKLNTNGGTVKVLGECFNLFPAADVLALTDFSKVFSYDSDDFVTSLLYAPTTDAEASAAINSINDLDERFFADLVIKFPWTVTGNQAITHKTQLRINCGAGGSLTVAKDASFSHMSRGNVFINNGGAAGSLPACKNLGFMNIGSFHIEPDCTFSSSGIAEIQSLDLGGSVALDGGTFRVNNKLNTNGGTVKVLGECFNIFPAEGVLPDPNVIVTHGNVKTNLLFSPQTNEQAAEAITVVNGLDDRFVGDIRIEFPWELSGKNVFRHKAEIRVNADRGGSIYLAQDALLANNGNGGNVFIENHSNSQNAAVSEIYGELNTNGLSLASGCELKVGENGWVKTHDRLNIPEDAKLTITKGQMHLMDNSVATVGGTLENNGYMSLRNRIGSNPRLVIDGGTYSGDGRIDVEDTVDPDSYFSGLNLDLFTEVPGNNATIYLPIKIDLVLPTGLTEIGAQAFANDTFASIFIPPTVTAIADDAFAGMSGLTIFGFPGTAAQNVTGDSFTFISVG